MSGWSFEYTIDPDVENRLVHVKIFGVWKAETAHSFKEDFEEETVEVIKQPWAKLTDLSNWKIAYPEVVNVIAEHLRWAKAHNMQWSINIIDNRATYKTLQKMWAKGGTTDISKTFRTRVEAETFLKQQGYRIGSAEPPAGWR
jgi:hypothetical protein